MAKKNPITSTRPKIQKAIFQARYKPNLAFFNRLFSAAEKFPEYPHWQTDSGSVELWDITRRCSFGIRHNNFGYDQDSGDTDQEKDNIGAILDRLPAALGLDSYIRLGFRRLYLIQTELRFSELVNILNLKFFAQEAELLKILPRQVDDLLYRVFFKEEDLRIHATMGPVKKEEIPSYISFNKEHHLDPKRPGEYQEILKSYPEVAVFVDLDVFRVDIQDGIPLNNGTAFVEDARSRIDQIVGGLFSYIFR